MKMGANYYKSLNTVTEFVEGERIAWEPKGNYVWRYHLAPVTGGTLITEGWDARRSPRRFMMAFLVSLPGTRKQIVATLERLAQQFNA